MNRVARHFVVAVSLFIVAACSDSTAAPEPSTVRVTGAGSALATVGQTLQLSASVSDQNGNPMPSEPVAWSSSADQVATVSASGLVTARGNGTAQITARAGGAAGGAGVTVTLVPAGVELLSGGSQVGRVAELLPDSIRIRVTDAGGAPIRGTAVQAQVVGGGSVSPPGGTTRDDGTFAAAWTLGTASGSHQTVSLIAGPRSVDVGATALPGTPAEIQVVSGDQQEAWAGDPLDAMLVVRVADAFSNGVPDESVAWAASSGAGTLTQVATVTDSAGLASARWTAGTTLGTTTVTVGSGGLLPRALTANVNPNAVLQGTVSSSGAWGLETSHHPASPYPDAAPGGTRRDAAWIEALNAREPAEFLVQVRVERAPGAMALLSGAGGIAEAERTAHAIRGVLEQAVAASGGAAPWEVVDVSPAIGFATVRVAEGAEAGSVEAQLASIPGVVHVEPNRLIGLIEPVGADAGSMASVSTQRVGAHTVTSASLIGAEPSFQPSADALWPYQAWHYKMVGAWEAWARTRGDASIVVAVVDDGVRTDHPELADRLTDGFSFVSSTPIPRCSGGSVPNDGHGNGPGSDVNTPRKYRMHSSGCVLEEEVWGGHGLHVAGTIAGNADNVTGGSGVAPGVRILPVRVLGSSGSGPFSDVADGVLYAAGFPVSDRRGAFIQTTTPARIINLSLGGSQPSVALLDAIRQAHDAGVLIIAAAGNENRAPVAFPAAFPEVIAVSALSPDESLASYSNRGPEIELAAPGGAPGNSGDFTHRVCSSYWNFQSSEPGTQCISGTSMAAPHVAGVAALVWSRDPGLSSSQVRQVLRATANPRGSGSPNVNYGYGIVQADGAVWAATGIPSDPRVLLYDESGALVRETPVGSGGSFEFRRLAPGDYRVFAGQILYGDGRIGVPLRQWGAHGPTGAATTVSIGTHGTWEAPVSMGYPSQTGQNRTSGSPDWLPIGGYLVGHLRTPADQAWFEVQVPEAGTYVFQTRGVLGACGLALVANTYLELRSSTGAVIASNGSEGSLVSMQCSRIERALEPGRYILRVTNEAGNGGFFGILAGRQGG